MSEIGYGTRYTLSLIEPHEVIVNFFVTNDSIHRILVGPYGTNISYQLHQLLKDYGEPDEIWVQGWPYNDDHVPHFAVLVIYKSKGIMARYNGDAIFTQESLHICPFDAAPELILWDPVQENQEELVTKLIDAQSNKWSALEFQLLENVADISVDNFYNTMLNQEGCFETPTIYWDDQG